ncbi:hypothetical protein [Hymenobacter mucosus]|uniref:SUKH-3 immunity protein n=1 Tax=Hymenobacter mucosus TaxID=1411120 RepID=A0A238V3V8_9BACT|nr:hypothetical protein [Hymenobacter mucosus]SNR28774.1 hypothetical protein SAMN06269173_10147 [Hymenobacter mucosus]
MMHAEMMRQAMEIAGIKMRVHSEPLRDENKEVLRRIGLPEEAQQFFVAFSFNIDLEIGELHYDQANCFKKNLEWEDGFQRALRAGLLVIGSGSTGDPIALDIQDLQAGYLFHDYFWEQEAEDPRKFFIKMNCSLGQLFLNSVSVEEYPVDAYEAAAYMGSEFTGHEDLEDDR